MRNIRLTIEYDGTHYAGWQFQPRQSTVQAVIEKALHKILGEKVRLFASGRTDSGVHAKGQVANFRTRSSLETAAIKKALNANLPRDIAIKDCRSAGPGFNARFDARAKHYRYTIYNGPQRLAVGRQYACYVPYPLNIAMMKKAAAALTGRNDFKSFHAAGRKIKNFTRRIKRIDIKKDRDNFIYIDIEADGFLYKMARNIVGTLVGAATGRTPATSIRKILKAKDRALAGPTMPARGLCLIKVKYAVFFAAISLFLAQPVSAQQQEPAITVDYSDARIFNNIGVEFVSQSKYEEAAKEFEKALAIDANFHIARYNLALAYYNMGRTKEAISEFEYLVNSSYYFVNAHYNLGTIYLREGMMDKAIEQLGIVTELEPQHPEAHFNLGFIFFKNNMLDEAIAEYKKGLQVRPDTLKARLSLAFLYEKKGLYKEAVEEYSAGLQLRPDHEEARQALGCARAIAEIKEAVNLTPRDAVSYVYMGHIYYSRGMYQEAINSYNEALQLDPLNSRAKESAEKAVMQMVNSEAEKR